MQAETALQNYFYQPEQDIFIFGGQAEFGKVLPSARLTELTKKLESAFLKGDRQFALMVYEEILSLLLENHLYPKIVKDELSFVLKRTILALNQKLDAAEYQQFVLFLESTIYDDANVQTLKRDLRLLVDFTMTLLQKLPEKRSSTLLQISYCIKSMPLSEINLTTVAAYFHYTPSYFSKIFKEEYGISFSEYLCSYRLNQAKELLATGKYKVNEVSEKIGLTETRYFSRLFKKKFGMTPDVFRRAGNHQLSHKR